ncbi:alpha-amylase 2 [bacterium BMS3Abin03]|nr:alpha-amylase 2 [bacterium BMS3Abin03]
MKRNLASIIILLLSLFSFVDAQELENVVKHPGWSYDKTIYEVNIRQYTPEGTFKEFEKHLTQLKKMNVGILWFMPVQPIGIKNRKGTLGSYYSVKDYKAVNPEFGTLNEFKAMVQKIHAMGMYVIIDWVANHTAWDNIWMKEHPGFYTKDSLGSVVSPVPDWTDVADLDYSNKELWTEMIDALKFWVEEYDIDGFRCDVAGMIPLEFWIEARKELDKIKPVFMLAEWDTPEMHKAFDMTYDWKTNKLMNSIAEGKKSTLDLIKHLKDDKKRYPPNAFRMQFTSNHDENSWNGTVFERLAKGAASFAVFTCLIPDMPLVYSGQEAGLNKRLRFFDKDTIEWKKSRFRTLYTKMFRLKKTNKALFNGIKGGELKFINSSNNKSVLAFTRQKGKDKILALFNFSNNNVEAELEGKNLHGTYREYFNGRIKIFSNKEKFTLYPWEYRVYVR